MEGWGVKIVTKLSSFGKEESLVTFDTLSFGMPLIARSLNRAE